VKSRRIKHGSECSQVQGHILEKAQAVCRGAFGRVGDYNDPTCGHRIAEAKDRSDPKVSLRKQYKVNSQVSNGGRRSRSEVEHRVSEPRRGVRESAVTVPAGNAPTSGACAH